jgi:hypothetical protein
MKRPNFEAPAPAKGILKKSNSNPQLTKLELVRNFYILFLVKSQADYFTSLLILD